jgi:hypothetical protein
MLSLTEGYLSPCLSLSLSLSLSQLSWLSPSPTGNKESLGQITPLHVVILGPTFPTTQMSFHGMNVGYNCTEYYSEMKMYKLLVNTTSWVNFKGIMMNEKCQSKKSCLLFYTIYITLSIYSIKNMKCRLRMARGKEEPVGRNRKDSRQEVDVGIRR